MSGPMEAIAAFQPGRCAHHLLRPCACAHALSHEHHRQGGHLLAGGRQRHPASADPHMARGDRRRRAAARRGGGGELRRLRYGAPDPALPARALRHGNGRAQGAGGRAARKARASSRSRDASACAGASAPEWRSTVSSFRSIWAPAAWRSSGPSTREGDPTPLVMKIPLLIDSDDPLPIVCFETEQMIMPHLIGRACPPLRRNRSARAHALHRHGADSGRIAERAPRRGAAALARRRRHRCEGGACAARSASAACDPSRREAEQRDDPRDRRGGSHRLRLRPPRAPAGSSGRGVPRALRHDALHGAGAGAAGPGRSAQRSLRARRDAVFLRHRRTPLRQSARRPDPPPPVARSGAAAGAETRLPALAAGDHPALPGGRPAGPLCHGGAARARSGESRIG